MDDNVQLSTNSCVSQCGNISIYSRDSQDDAYYQLPGIRTLDSHSQLSLGEGHVEVNTTTSSINNSSVILENDDLGIMQAWKWFNDPRLSFLRVFHWFKFGLMLLSLSGATTLGPVFLGVVTLVVWAYLYHTITKAMAQKGEKRPGAKDLFLFLVVPLFVFGFGLSSVGLATLGEIFNVFAWAYYLIRIGLFSSIKLSGENRFNSIGTDDSFMVINDLIWLFFGVLGFTYFIEGVSSLINSKASLLSQKIILSSAFNWVGMTILYGADVFVERKKREQQVDDGRLEEPQQGYGKDSKWSDNNTYNKTWYLLFSKTAFECIGLGLGIMQLIHYFMGKDHGDIESLNLETIFSGAHGEGIIIVFAVLCVIAMIAIMAMIFVSFYYRDFQKEPNILVYY